MVNCAKINARLPQGAGRAAIGRTGCPAPAAAPVIRAKWPPSGDVKALLTWTRIVSCTGSISRPAPAKLYGFTKVLLALRVGLCRCSRYRPHDACAAGAGQARDGTETYVQWRNTHSRRLRPEKVARNEGIALVCAGIYVADNPAARPVTARSASICPQTLPPQYNPNPGSLPQQRFLPDSLASLRRGVFNNCA
jgi:hypothetical protein